MSADLAESAAISDSVDTLSTRGGLVEETAAAAAAQAVADRAAAAAARAEAAAPAAAAEAEQAAVDIYCKSHSKLS